MSRIATPAEKTLAVVGVYRALWTELFIDPLAEIDTRLAVQLLASATQIAMGTDTRDMGIMLAAHDKAVADFNNNGCVSNCPPEGHYEECELASE